jgi:hypothetical protein
MQLKAVVTVKVYRNFPGDDNAMPAIQIGAALQT